MKKLAITKPVSSSTPSAMGLTKSLGQSRGLPRLSSYHDLTPFCCLDQALYKLQGQTQNYGERKLLAIKIGFDWPIAVCALLNCTKLDQNLIFIL